MAVSRVYPMFLSALQTTSPPTEVVSPAAAMFLLLQLLQMKMTDTSYQIDPDTWVRSVEAKRKEAASRPPSHSAVLTVERRSSKELRQYQALSRKVASNSDGIVRPIQALLTTFG